MIWRGRPSKVEVDIATISCLPLFFLRCFVQPPNHSTGKLLISGRCTVTFQNLQWNNCRAKQWQRPFFLFTCIVHNYIYLHCQTSKVGSSKMVVMSNQSGKINQVKYVRRGIHVLTLGSSSKKDRSKNIHHIRSHPPQCPSLVYLHSLCKYKECCNKRHRNNGACASLFPILFLYNAERLLF